MKSIYYLCAVWQYLSVKPHYTIHKYLRRNKFLLVKFKEFDQISFTSSSHLQLKKIVWRRLYRRRTHYYLLYSLLLWSNWRPALLGWYLTEINKIESLNLYLHCIPDEKKMSSLFILFFSVMYLIGYLCIAFFLSSFISNLLKWIDPYLCLFLPFR